VRCFLKQKGKLDLEVQYFFESKESSERKCVPGNKNGKKDYKANMKVVDQRNSAKPREKPIENREQRN